MAGRRLFQNAVLIDPEARSTRPGSLLIEGGRIVTQLDPGEAPPEGVRSVDLGGALLAPGLIDLHFHGSLVFAADDPARSLQRDSESQARHGVTAFLATTVALPHDALHDLITHLARTMTHDAAWPGAVPLGLHLEGPWISPGAAGAQPGAGIRPYRAAEGRALLDAAAARVRMVTLAPEVPGAAELLDELARRDIVAALGHSLAGADQVREAVGRGARHVTHLFNAMGRLHQREPGLAGTALAEAGLSCDVICDGVHVHPAWIRVITRVKGERLVLISDRISPPRNGGASFGSGPLQDDGAVWRLPDGSLAGSRLTLDRALANLRHWRVMNLAEAVVAATLAPARLLGIEAERGTLRAGARADLVVLDPETGVRETWVAGRRVHPPS